jgi:dihydroorotate dehydrogenase electron transfer subunit
MLPTPTKITRVEQETKTVKTYYFDDQSYAIPGQFYMVWVPGLEEKPMSVSGTRPLSLTICGIGPASIRMNEYKEGECMFLRGPLGKGFRLEGKSVLGIGGGYGFGPVRYALLEMQKKGAKTKAILGAKNKDWLLRPAAGCETIITTNDGSSGKKGLVTDALLGLFDSGEKFDTIFTCGPERMMKAIAEICKDRKIGCQMLLERYMKCGIGVCGQCVIGDRLVCRDGPMFGIEALSFADFGATKLDRTSERIPI